MKNFLLLIVIVAVILSCVCPPWYRIYRYRGANAFESLGYAWLWKPPITRRSFTSGEPSSTARIDFGRVQLQVGALLFLGACILFSRYIFEPRGKRLCYMVLFIVLSIPIGFLLITAIVFVGNKFWGW